MELVAKQTHTLLEGFRVLPVLEENYSHHNLKYRLVYLQDHEDDDHDVDEPEKPTVQGRVLGGRHGVPVGLHKGTLTWALTPSQMMSSPSEKASMMSRNFM